MTSAFTSHAWLLLSLASSVHAHDNSLFRNFFPLDMGVRELLATNCSDEINKLRADPSRGGHGTVTCLLDYLSEITKAEMGMCSIILGLLPMALHMVGPKVSEISIVAQHRPFLSFLISVGSPCATLEHEQSGMEPSQQNDPLWDIQICACR